MGSSIMGPKVIFVPLCIEVLVKFVSAVQGSAKRQSPGLVNFVTALAYHFCLALPAAFTQPGDHLLDDPCVRYVVSSISVVNYFKLCPEEEISIRTD